MSAAHDQRSVTELVGDVVDQFTKLIRNEIAIARTELTTKATETAVGAGFLIGGALLLIPAMVLLLMALAAWMVELGLSASGANLIAGIVGLLVSGALAYVGKRRLSLDHLMPKRTMREIERDIAAVKDTTR
jgi:membrane protein implicated in regulation of membrane protease activity